MLKKLALLSETSISPPHLKGKFLFAMPSSEEGPFEHTVAYLCEHSDEGALGFIINRPAPLTLGALFQSIHIQVENECFQQPVFLGGPLDRNRGFVVHTGAAPWASSARLSHELWLTTSRDILEAISEGRGPHRFQVFLGYAGWGPMQLEVEMADNQWLCVPYASELLFEAPADERWRRTAELLGIDIECLSSEVGHA